MNDSALSLFAEELIWAKPGHPFTAHMPVRKVSLNPLMSCRDCVFVNTDVCKQLDCILGSDSYFFKVEDSILHPPLGCVNLNQFIGLIPTLPVDGPHVVVEAQIIKHSVKEYCSFPFTCENCFLCDQHNACDEIIDHCSLNYFSLIKIK